MCTWKEPNDYEQWSGKWEQIRYPMLPETWGIKPIGDDRKQAVVQEIYHKVQSGEYGGLINCCDSGTEGSGIFWLLVHYLHLEHVPTLRFMEHSLTDKEIRESLLSMKPVTAPEHVRSSCVPRRSSCVPRRTGCTG